MIRFNWIDLFSLIILIRIGYISFKNGLFIEIIKILATLVSVVLGLHFFIRAGSFIKACLFLPGWLAKEIALLFIFLVSFLVFYSLRVFVFKVMTTKFATEVDKAGAIIVGLGRGFLTVSMILVMLNILPGRYIQKSLWRHSLTGPTIIKVAPVTYKYLFRFVPHGVVNNILTKKGEKS